MFPDFLFSFHAVCYVRNNCAVAPKKNSRRIDNVILPLEKRNSKIRIGQVVGNRLVLSGCKV